MEQEQGSADYQLDAPTLAEVKALELFRRSPHPYLRHKEEIRNLSPGRLRPPTGMSLHRPNPPNRTISDADGRKRRKALPGSQSPSESGTEADDEGYTFVKALPPPPSRPHKGLRESGLGHGAVSPLLTPTQIDDEGRTFTKGYFSTDKKKPHRGDTSSADEGAIAARRRYLKRRRNELLRRTTEVLLLTAIGLLTVGGCGCWEQIFEKRRELATHAIVIIGLLALYPIRVFYYSWRKGNSSSLYLWQRIHVPAAFDPATVLYPPIMPMLISVSLFSSFSDPLLPNIILGLAALPSRLIPFKAATLGYSNLHWFLSILPLIAVETANRSLGTSDLKPHEMGVLSQNPKIEPELLVSLFALHQALLPPLHYLTTTSLLPTELHLLSIGLINLLFFADSPQMSILKILMWLGGLGIFVLCGKVLKWGVALARIPRWRLRRAGHIVKNSQSLFQILNQTLKPKRSRSSASARVCESDADEDEHSLTNPLRKTRSLKVNILDAVKSAKESSMDLEPRSAIETSKSSLRVLKDNTNGTNGTARQRRNTLPTLPGQNHTQTPEYIRRKRSKSIAQSYLSLTPNQATTRKWLYAGYFYLLVVALILGPIRYTISKYALHDHEPFGWAISYLFGNIPRLRWEVYNWDLDAWIPLPPLLDTAAIHHKDTPLPLAEHFRHVIIGEANTRLVLCVYCVATIVVGLLSVFSLSAVVEVDTRRKVFHGTMVAMLLPTIFIDPCFVALALALVLAIFLLLDLIRASQLPPLSKPIAKFLTPYVDGRDLRGPVVVSHIFLLIGCAIPLWLSLAGVARTGEEPWEGWDVETRDVSMLAGVVCVGMGDAAASLIGRRYGRRKWPWAGGKSLEGSLAFAVAVTVGLVFGKIWLAIGWGGMRQYHKSVDVWVRDALVTTAKAALCAAGASLNEAVLTGGNDNVVVPVVLWVLVRGVGL